LDLLRDGGDVGHRREGLVERVVLAVGRLPVAARRRAEHVVGDLDAVEAEILGRLAPVADLRRVGTDVARREEGIELHRFLRQTCRASRLYEAAARSTSALRSILLVPASGSSGTNHTARGWA